MNAHPFFQDKIAIITGASSGIGKALALKLAQAGAKVVLAARSEARLFELEKHITASGHAAMVVRTDMTVEQDIANLLYTTMGSWGRIDMFISNAGQYVQAAIQDTCAEDFHTAFAVNFFGPYYAVKGVLPIMARQKSGHIVLINSLDAKVRVIGDAPYAAAKSALDGFGDILRQEARPLGIKVLSVFPGRVDTPMIEHLKTPWISPKIPPEKVAEAVMRGMIKDQPVVYVPGNTFLFKLLNDLSPRTMDWFLKKLHVEGEKIR